MPKIFLICLSFFSVFAYTQSDVGNTQKYWKFRNNFRQKFVKIGDQDGESFPMAILGIKKPRALRI
jgi:hypothetical protein